MALVAQQARSSNIYPPHNTTLRHAMTDGPHQHVLGEHDDDDDAS